MKVVKAAAVQLSLAVEAGDNNTKVLLESILKEEEDHIDWIEGQLGRSSRWGYKLIFRSKSTKCKRTIPTIPPFAHAVVTIEELPVPTYVFIVDLHRKRRSL